MTEKKPRPVVNRCDECGHPVEQIIYTGTTHPSSEAPPRFIHKAPHSCPCGRFNMSEDEVR